MNIIYLFRRNVSDIMTRMLFSKKIFNFLKKMASLVSQAIEINNNFKADVQQGRCIPKTCGRWRCKHDCVIHHSVHIWLPLIVWESNHF